jgi:hypothetical protein
MFSFLVEVKKCIIKSTPNGMLFSISVYCSISAINALNGKTSKFAADDCDNAWEQFTQNTSGKNGVLLGYGTIKGQTVTIIANKYDRGSSNYVGHMLTQDHIYVNNHYNSENHEKILV